MFFTSCSVALNSTGNPNLYNTTSANNRPMTDEDFRRIEQNLAEEVRRKNCQMGSQQYDSELYHFSDVENTPGTKINSYLAKLSFSRVFSDPSDSMFCSVKGMSTSIDLESSYTSSRPDSASTSSKRNSYRSLEFIFRFFRSSSSFITSSSLIKCIKHR